MRYFISIDLDAFDEARVTRNRAGETVMLLNLDRTPGVHRAASGNYYLNLIAFEKKAGKSYGTHLLARSLTKWQRDEVREGRRHEYPPVGNLSPWDEGRRIRGARRRHLEEWGVDPDAVEAAWDGGPDGEDGEDDIKNHHL